MRARWLAVGAVWMAGGALADGHFAITLPDVSGLGRAEAEALIAELAAVNVITSNCAGWTVDDATWALLTGAGDLLAMQLGIDPAAYDDTYYGPAFALLEDPSACDRIGPKARPLIARLAAMGGRVVIRNAADTGSESGPVDRAPGPQAGTGRAPDNRPAQAGN